VAFLNLILFGCNFSVELLAQHLFDGAYLTG